MHATGRERHLLCRESHDGLFRPHGSNRKEECPAGTDCKGGAGACATHYRLHCLARTRGGRVGERQPRVLRRLPKWLTLVWSSRVPPFCQYCKWLLHYVPGKGKKPSDHY